MDSEVQPTNEDFILSDAPLLVEEQQEIDLRNLEHPRAKYPKEIKLKAVAMYCSLGNAVKVARDLGLPEHVVKEWKNNSPWWDELSIKIRKEQQRDLDATITSTIHHALSEITDRINYGDLKLDSKTGDLIRVPVSAKDLTVTMGILYDKRALLRGEATSIRTESKASLQTLKDMLTQHATQLKEKDVIAIQ